MTSLSRYTKTIVALVGAIATWAISTFPDNHQVQLIGGLIGVIVTSGAVYQFPNTPPDGEPADPEISEQGHGDAAGLVYLAAALLVILVLLRVFHLI